MCDRQVALMSDGVVRSHVFAGVRCEGWGMRPKERLVDDLLQERFGESA